MCSNVKWMKDQVQKAVSGDLNEYLICTKQKKTQKMSKARPWAFTLIQQSLNKGFWKITHFLFLKYLQFLYVKHLTKS